MPGKIWLALNGGFPQLKFMQRYLLLVPINFLAAGILTFCLNWLTAISWRKATTAHWTERARLLWPVRTSGAINIWLIPVCLSLVEAGSGPASWSGCVVPAIAGLLGAILATFPLDREIFPRFTFGSWLRLVTMSWTNRAGFLGIFLIGALLMPDELGLPTVVLGASVLSYILALHFGLYLRFLRWLGMLRPPDARLRAIVARAAQRMGVREPRTWLLDVPLAQAFALPATGELMFSSRFLEISSDEEISSISAHELAHLTESKSVLARRIAGSMTLYPLIFARPAANIGPAALCAMIALVWLAATLARKLARRMENRADKIAAENQGAEGVYARALEKLYRDNLTPAVAASNRKTHSHLYDRMLAAGIQPDYPRPAKPEPMAWSFVFICIALGILIGLTLARGAK